jgi:hypothetical protein
MMQPRYRLLPGVGGGHACARAIRAALYELAHRGELRCSICGTRLLDGDPVGRCGARPVHAECALVHWLGHRQPSARTSNEGLTEEARHDLDFLALDE